MGDASVNFQNFVTAHGPFELTAIILSAGAGLKIGLSWLMTNGLSRKDSLIKTARETLPIAMCAVVLFCFAAMIEGFVSPTPHDVMPWWIKGTVGTLSSCLLMFYFVVLGYPKQGSEVGIDEI
jgi:drug/metabolite transporter (DMT)-like permease